MVYCFVKTRTLEGVECHPFHVRSTFRDSATHFQIQPIKARAAGCCCSVRRLRHYSSGAASPRGRL